MAYVNRPYGSNYCDAERQVIREAPYGGAYGSDYRVDEYGNRIYHHQNALGNTITEVVSEVIPGDHHHHNHHYHHHGRPARPAADIIDRRDGCVFDTAYDPYRTY